MQINTLKQSGFTLIELLVVAPLVILLIGVMIGYISAVTGDGLKAQQQNSLAYEAQNALDDIDTNTARAVSFKDRTANIQPPQGLNDSGTNFTSNDDFLVLESIALTGNSSDDARTAVYTESGNGAGVCNTSSAPYTYYTVYFVSSNTLYKRTILPNTPKCGTPQQKNSCSVAGLQSTPGICQVEDEKLTDNVLSFKISYLNDANQITSFPLATTVSIKLDTQKSVAGTNLTYTATMRAKKQNSVQPLAAQTPTVNGNNLTHPDDFYCTWDQLPNASSYSFQYRFNAESWSTPELISTGSKKIDVTSRRGQRLECQVTANLTAGGTLAYTPFVANPVPLWTSPTLENNWVRYDNLFAGFGYTKTASGMIVLKGLVRAGTVPSRIFQLPAGYRPSKALLFQQSTGEPNTHTRVDISSDGSITAGGNGWVSLSGINFQPTGTFIAPTFAGNGWENYSPNSGDLSWLPAGYMVDSVGRLRTQGLVRAGTVTNNTVIFNIPSNLRPAQYEHIASHDSGTFGVTGIGPTYGGVVAKGGNNVYLETNILTYPNTFSGWTALPLINPWTVYPGFTTPKYVKGSDGLVMLKGFVQSGSTGTYILNIPGNQGLCPKERHVYAVAAAGVYGRIDVEPGTASGGCGVSFHIGSNVWVSLDAITWIAEI